MAVSVGHRSMWRDRSGRWATGAVIVAGAMGLIVYQGVWRSAPASTEATLEHALVQPVDGTDVARVTLSAHAIKRLDLRTAQAENVLVKAKRRTVVPYGAILYDATGQTWVYASPKAGTFVRQRVSVDVIDGNRAILAARAAAGLRVVTVGVQELWGAELGIDDTGH
jgi:hypothetical protein